MVWWPVNRDVCRCLNLGELAWSWFKKVPVQVPRRTTIIPGNGHRLSIRTMRRVTFLLSTGMIREVLPDVLNISKHPGAPRGSGRLSAEHAGKPVIYTIHWLVDHRQWSGTNAMINRPCETGALAHAVCIISFLPLMKYKGTWKYTVY